MRYLALLFLLLSMNAAAGPAPSLSVLQMELGRPFTFSQCPTKKYGRLMLYELQPKRPCWKHDHGGPRDGTPAPDSFTGILELPRGDVPQPLHAENIRFVVVKGNLEGLRFQTSGYSAQDAALELLTAKYGTGDVKRDVMQNRMGASFEEVSAIWEFDDLRVVLFGMLGRVDVGLVGMLTPTAQAFEAQQLEAKKAAQPQL